jgi:hypothetical protein
MAATFTMTLNTHWVSLHQLGNEHKGLQALQIFLSHNVGKAAAEKPWKLLKSWPHTQNRLRASNGVFVNDRAGWSSPAQAAKRETLAFSLFRGWKRNALSFRLTKIQCS